MLNILIDIRIYFSIAFQLFKVLCKDPLSIRDILFHENMENIIFG